MHDHARRRMEEFQRRLDDQSIPLAILTSPASIAYLGGFWGYLGVEFGRPTLLVVRPDYAPTVITPAIEAEMVRAMGWIEDVRGWEDAGSRSWERVLGDTLGRTPAAVWVERATLPAMVRNWLDDVHPMTALENIGPVIGAQRMIKAPDEIEAMRQAGLVGAAMMRAAAESLGEGVPEYESALAVTDAGTRAAAELLSAEGWDAFVPPMIPGLQILQSGSATSMVHRRAGLKRYARGDQVYFCFCNRLQFKHYRLGFDRMFHIGEASDEAARADETARAAQGAALAAIRPGVAAETVAEASNAVYEADGHGACYRAGRAIGLACLEAPELKAGDATVLEPGMTFAVDGGVSVEGVCAGRIGDSVVVTEDGFEFLTEYPRELLVV